MLPSVSFFLFVANGQCPGDCLSLRPKLKEWKFLILMFDFFVVFLAVTRSQCAIFAVVLTHEVCSSCMKMLFKIHRLCKTPF